MISCLVAVYCRSLLTVPRGRQSAGRGPPRGAPEPAGCGEGARRQSLHATNSRRRDRGRIRPTQEGRVGLVHAACQRLGGRQVHGHVTRVVFKYMVM